MTMLDAEKLPTRILWVRIHSISSAAVQSPSHKILFPLFLFAMIQFACLQSNVIFLLITKFYYLIIQHTCAFLFYFIFNFALKKISISFKFQEQIFLVFYSRFSRQVMKFINFCNKYKIRQLIGMEVNLSNRYHSHELSNLVNQLNSQTDVAKKLKIKSIQEQRKIHSSCIEISKNSLEFRKNFNNKTKYGQFFTPHPPQVPYLFIPKYKNETFIMPDRVFEKGNAGKRFHIKMKDTSIYSFKDSQNDKMTEFLHKRQKNDVISGRKMQQLNRILDQSDGKLKAKAITRHLKTRKIFNPTRTSSDMFSMADPMLEPKDDQITQTKKTHLNKTFGPNMWRPASRAQSCNRTMNNCFSQTTSVFSVTSNR